MKATHLLMIALWLVSAGAAAQHRRDPLTPTEVDQLRDTAVEPEERLKLYVLFARARLDSLEKARTDSKPAERAQTIHDRLQDFLDVYDELDENIDTYVDRKDDIRKPLKLIIEADTEFQAKLLALKDSSTSSSEEFKTYEFLLSDTLETLDQSAKDHRQTMVSQEDLAKKKKERKKK